MIAPCVLFLLSACRPQTSSSGFFDLKGFITKEAGRLNKLDPPVVKTVYHNGVTETKTVKIDDWKRELGMFINADINKPSWKNSYDVISEDSLLVYRAKGNKEQVKQLFVHELIIDHVKQKVRWILIYTGTPQEKLNIFNLYNTTQKLVYYPDSLYSIEMVQHIRTIGTNVYKIQGKILKTYH